MNFECGILINCSRSIIYSSNGYDFAEKAKQKNSTKNVISFIRKDNIKIKFFFIVIFFKLQSI